MAENFIGNYKEIGNTYAAAANPIFRGAAQNVQEICTAVANARYEGPTAEAFQTDVYANVDKMVSALQAGMTELANDMAKFLNAFAGGFAASVSAPGFDSIQPPAKKPVINTPDLRVDSESLHAMEAQILAASEAVKNALKAHYAVCESLAYTTESNVKESNNKVIMDVSSEISTGLSTFVTSINELVAKQIAAMPGA